MIQAGQGEHNHKKLLSDLGELQKTMTPDAICARLHHLHMEEGVDIFAVLCTDLHSVVRQGDVRSLRLFLSDEKVPKNEKDDHGDTALSVAALLGMPIMADELLLHGCEKDTKNNKGWTPTHCAASRNHVRILEVLHKHGSDMNRGDKTGVTPVHLAAQANSMEALQLLFDMHDGDLEVVSAETNSGVTPAHIAAAADNPDILRCLQRMGVDLETRDRGGDTPAHKAARFNHVEAIEYLQSVGVDMNVPNNEDDTALDLMNMSGRYDFAGL